MCGIEVSKSIHQSRYPGSSMPQRPDRRDGDMCPTSFSVTCGRSLESSMPCVEETLYFCLTLRGSMPNFFMREISVVRAHHRGVSAIIAQFRDRRLQRPAVGKDQQTRNEIF